MLTVQPAIPIPIPEALAAQRRLGPGWEAWLARLPAVARTLLDEWGLTVDGRPSHGYCSLVLPVQTADDAPAALKVTFDGDRESEHEALALQHWNGAGTVRLLRADPRRRALLLERLQTRDLGALDDLAACEIVARSYQRLHRPAPPQLRSLSDELTRWLADLRDRASDMPLPRRMVEQALHLGDALVSDSATVGVIVHGDLHYANVLAAEREPWLVIDPKPLSGDPHYEPAPLLWNRWDDLGQGDLRQGIRRRFHTIVDVAALDEDRARDWVIVRMIINAHWTIQEAQRTERRLAGDDNAWLTRCLTVAKAVAE